MLTSKKTDDDFTQLAHSIKAWAKDFGFQQVGISDIDLREAEQRLTDWLAQGFHGAMQYMAKHAELRAHPEQLLPGTVRVISVRMDYLPQNARLKETLANPNKAYISRYALGRDYHKLIRKRLQGLADKIARAVGPFGYRAFSDSAPVLEKPIAAKAGIGWTGKHSLILNRQAGSWFFLGELFTDLPLPLDQPVKSHCGRCSACLDICPTDAFVGPYQLDAKRCISYLTIEYKGSIPEELRAKMGNRIFGCDDCQIVCPWNRFAKPTHEADFQPRHGLEDADLCELFAWDEATFLAKTAGSPIRRAGYESWLRNIAIALGNAPRSAAVRQALQARLDHPSALVREHVRWALNQHKI